MPVYATLTRNWLERVWYLYGHASIYKAGDAGVSGDALCRRWERTSYLLTDDEDHTGQTDDEEDSEEEGEEEDD